MSLDDADHEAFDIMAKAISRDVDDSIIESMLAAADAKFFKDFSDLPEPLRKIIPWVLYDWDGPVLHHIGNGLLIKYSCFSRARKAIVKWNDIQPDEATLNRGRIILNYLETIWDEYAQYEMKNEITSQ